MQSFKKPTDQQVDEAIQQLIQGGHESYFFDRLQNPEWIEPLRRKGFFNSPPAPVANAENSSVSLPNWPPAKYLARMAIYVPDQVLAIIRKTPPTENGIVLESFVDALLAMPSDMAATMASTASTWVGSPYNALLLDKLARLAVHFSKGGQTKPAIKVARALLQVDGRSSDTLNKAALPPLSRRDEWEYERVLSILIADMMQAAPWETLTILANALRGAIGIKGSGSDRDYSFIWRPAIEDHEQNSDRSLADHLIKAIRDESLKLLDGDPENATKLLKVLRSHDTATFVRLELYLLSRAVEIVPGEVASRLTDRVLFENPRLKHEYSALLEQGYRFLDHNQQETIINWILSGPNTDDREEDFRTADGISAEEARRSFISHWQREKIAWFGNVAPAELAALYADLVALDGAPLHPTFGSYSTFSEGAISPITEEEVAGATIEEVVVRLREWKPSGKFMGPSREGLAETLKAAVAKDPAKYSDRAFEFVNLDPIYVNSLLSVFARKDLGQCFLDWDGIFSLARATVEKDDKLTDSDPDDDSWNTTWQTAKLTLAWLMQEVLRQDRVPPRYSESAWLLLEELVQHPDPSPEDEAESVNLGSKPWDVALNTVRGSALLAVLEYGLWRLRHVQVASEQRRTFDEFPAMRVVLDSRLDPAVDSSLGGRAVLGQYFPWLLLMDEQWASASASRIFPGSEMEIEQWRAAWGAYVLFNQVYDNVFESLIPQYGIAIERMSLLIEADSDLNGALARHLMVLFWHGRLEEAQGARLFERFVDLAPTTVLSEAIDIIGQILDEPKSVLSAAQEARLLLFWESQLERAKQLPDSDGALYLAEFSGWFGSGRFDPKQSLPLMIECLRSARVVKHEAELVDRLVTVPADCSAGVAELLHEVVSLSRRSWTLDQKTEVVSQVIATLLASKDLAVAASARRTVDLLVAQGRYDYLSLVTTRREVDF